MNRRIALAWLAAFGPIQSATPQQAAEAPPQSVPAQESGRVRTTAVALRATTVRPGGVIIVDRGKRDSLQPGDKVVFHPRGQKSLNGRVRSVQNREAEIQLQDPNATFEEGTRGIVHIPVSRFAATDPEVQEQPATTEAEPVVEHAPWENTDEEYEVGMPLLVQVDGVRPEERLPLLSGRVYSIGEARITSDDKRGDHFFRLGTELNYENPFGQGGQLNFEGEANNRDTFVTDQVDESTSKGRIDRLSYSWGGTRFQPERHEAGRFLQHGIPEFGILDGYEWNRRLSNGNRFGTSIGYLPVPTPSLTSGTDFAWSAHYKWIADKRERLSATGAFQKTWHNGAADRDLFIGKFNYSPAEGWDLHATTWIDYYSSGDEAKSTGFDITRMIASTSKRWASGDALNFTFAHRSFPELDRFEFIPVLANQLANDRNDRISVDGWTWINPERKLRSRFGLWEDQEDSGADGDIGIEQFGVFLENGHLDASLFGTGGKFSTTYGVRLDYGIQLTRQRWDVSYEFSLNDQVGFDSNNDDLEQHRLIGSFDHTSDSGWSFSLHGGAIRWARETAVLASFYIQKSF